MSTVSIVLGSDSDIEVFERAARVLTELEVAFEQRIISAHRTPDSLREYIKDAEKRGILVFIAAAGMAAALPGAIASHTVLPVIGVPSVSKSPILGFDSIFSILQMPPGVPVACVSVNGGENAALLAVQILALKDESMKKRLLSYLKRMKENVRDKDRKFRDR